MPRAARTDARPECSIGQRVTHFKEADFEIIQHFGRMVEQGIGIAVLDALNAVIGRKTDRDAPGAPDADQGFGHFLEQTGAVFD
jgi:hypothetical protein